MNFIRSTTAAGGSAGTSRALGRPAQPSWQRHGRARPLGLAPERKQVAAGFLLQAAREGHVGVPELAALQQRHRDALVGVGREAR